VVRFAIEGSTIPQIAAITGHSVTDVRSILEAHYLYLDEALGDSAVEKRERSTKFPTDRLPTGLQTDSNCQKLSSSVQTEDRNIRTVNELGGSNKRRR